MAYKLCPTCKLNLIHDEEDCCSVCKTVMSNYSVSSDKFTILNQKKYYAGKYGYLIYDEKNRNIGIVFQSDDKRTIAYGQAEIRFYDQYKVKFGTWRRIFLNGERLMFSRLTQILNASNKYECIIDSSKKY